MKSRCSGPAASRRNRSWRRLSPNSASPIIPAACWLPTAATASSPSCDGVAEAGEGTAPGTHLRPRSTALPLRPGFGFFVGRLLGDPELLPNLSPQRAASMRPRHGLALGFAPRHGARQLAQRLALRLLPHLHSFLGFLRPSRIGARPALDVGLVDDPAQPPRAADHRVA